MRKLKYQTSMTSEDVTNEVKYKYPGKDIYEVYWVHLEDHVDVCTQGYVGITSQGVRTRFYKHLADSRTGKFDYIFHKALNKYKDSDLIVDTLCIGDLNYALMMESRLRPKSHIGWNTAEGGGGNPQKLKEITKTEEFSKNRSEYMNKSWSDPEYRNKMMESRKAYYEEVPPWRRYGESVNHSAWEMAGVYYLLYSKYGWGNGKISGYLMANSGSFCRIFDYFKNGWNPLEDQDYQQLYPTPTLKDVIKKYGHPEQYHISWKRKGASKAWKVADKLFDSFLDGAGVAEIAKESEVTWHQAHKIHRRFKNGWNLNEDPRWLKDFKGGRNGE